MIRIMLFLTAFLASVSVHAEIRVSAAVSLKEALTAIAENFTRHTGEKVTFTFGASGQLAAQIKAGAPVDLFISAAKPQVDDLIKANIADAISRTIVARNTLALIVPPDATGGIRDFSDLPKAARIAIGEPKTVPAGTYAMQTLASLKLASGLKDKLLFASNVRQVLDLVIRGEVDAGMVYLTDVKQVGDKVKLIASADANLHEPIEYPAVIIRGSANEAEARQFADYLRKPTAQTILSDRGFLISTTQPK